MLAGCLPEPALDMVRSRKRRDRPIETVVDRGGIVIRDDGIGEQVLHQGATGLGKLIQRQSRACDLCEYRQHAGARRGFQHQIVDAKPRCLRDDGRERQRGRELLHAHAVLRTPRVRRRQTGETFNHGEEGLRRGSLAMHQSAVARQHQDLGNLGHLVGIFPDPGTAGVAGTESLLHRGAQGGSVYGPARLE